MRPPCSTAALRLALLVALLVGPAAAALAAPTAAAPPAGPLRHTATAAGALHDLLGRKGDGPGPHGEPPRLRVAPRLEPAAVRRALADQQGAFAACATRAAKAETGPADLGRATLLLTVQPTGTVSRSSLARAELRGSRLGRCLVAAARRLTLPPFRGDAVELVLPLRLAAR